MEIHDKNVHLLLTAILLNTTDPKFKAEKDKSLQALTDDYYERNLKHGKDNTQKAITKKTT